MNVNVVLEILYALAAVATIAGFIFELWREHKQHKRMTKGD